MARRLFILFLTFGLFACDSGLVKEFVATPEIKNIQLSHFSVEDKQAVFDISLYNPNPFPLPISGMAGDIELNNMHIGSLEARSDKQLAAYDTQTITLPLSLNPDALFNAAQSVLLKGKADYNFTGQLNTSLGQVPFNKTGELSAKDILSSMMGLR
tara:strand:- start:33 stop:500 length:468 start_codon:yes stop_codon:yes gene_type:complete